MLASLPDPDRLAQPLEQRLASDFPQRLLVLPGGRQAIRECGGGPTIVLLHGIGSGAASWLQVAQRLAGRARVIAWDAPGYGDSAPLTQPGPRAEDYAARLAQLFDALDIERCVLVGHSLGALIATAFAAGEQARRVARLVLLSPARGYGDPARAALAEDVRGKRLRALERLGIAGMAEQRSAHLLSPRASAEQLAWVRWNMARLDAHGYRQAIELLCGDDLLRHAPLAVPCEVHCGELDAITKPESCHAIARALGAPFDLIPGAGHACPIEQAEVVAGRIAYALTQTQQGMPQ